MEPNVGQESCICVDGSQPENVREDMDKSWMIECDICHVWFHGGCMGLSPLNAQTIDKFHCPRCEPLCGPSLLLPFTNAHRHNPSDPMADSKRTQVGTQVFVESLKRREFAPADHIVQFLDGRDVNKEYLERNGFEFPILVSNSESLGLKIPKMSLIEIRTLVGAERPVEVIDVRRQETVSMTLGDFIEAFMTTDRQRILNCLSLEVTGTLLGFEMEAPKVIRDLCWVRNFWPNNLDYTQEEAPRVSKYCIISQSTSYTDFHIDFGGTSVWYHVITGRKVFYLVSPSTKNLAIFERWHRLASQSETFFADMVGECYKLEVCEGQTVFLPAGWIHSVFTPEDTIAIGGNFLHSLDMSMQLKLSDMEDKMRFPVKYKFPHLQTVTWLAAHKIVENLKNSQSKRTSKHPKKLLSGLKSLSKTLKSWDDPGVQSINCSKIIRDLSKIIKQMEKKSKEIKLQIQTNISQSEEEYKKPIKLIVPNPNVAKHNLTDRDSVRHLITERKKFAKDLNSELGNTLKFFENNVENQDGALNEEGETDEPQLQIDTTVTKLKIASSKPKSKENYFIPKIRTVHQDDDFVYPSLDFSDDEEDEIPPEAKSDKDELWNPKARVKQDVGKRSRIPRDGARRIEVEKGLQSASERMKSRKLLKKKLKKPSVSNKVETSSLRTSMKPSKPKEQVPKPKKGMATTKQRLMKKLGIKLF